MVDERLLNRMEAVTVGDPFDGCDGRAVGVKPRDEATVDEPSIEQHRTRAALALATPFLRSRQLQFSAQRIEQPGHRVRVHGDIGAVHAASDGCGAGSDTVSCHEANALLWAESESNSRSGV